uniref:RING-type domain-containing protein n=1 Tax=Globisporangium ultimum (strain ATCC 200006 / CBS 805.95 / DAOM BR144) TaxID=431595 RepID=K3WSD2_GLOUD
MEGDSSPRPPMRGHTPTVGNGKKPLLVNRSAEELRRNGLNMEKMIKKNVMASSRPGSLKRGLAVVEYFKAKNKQQDGGGAEGGSSSNAMDADPPVKRTKISPPPPSSSTSAQDDAVMTDATAGGSSVSVASPSPRRRSAEQTAVRMNLLMSAKASNAGVQPLDDRAFAARGPPSITRLSQQLTSPLRHRNSPVRSRIQAMTEESIRRLSENSSRASATGSGASKGLTAVLEQVDIAPTTNTKVGGLTSKSPFQSFQSKFSAATAASSNQSRPQQQPSPAKPKASALANLLASPMAPRHHSMPPPRSGPIVVDLSHGSEEKPARTSLTASKPLVTAPSKPARALFSSRPAVATKSLCFSTEGVATSLDVSPDGEILVVGFTDGSVRLYEMDSNVPSDRHGYLLGHIDEESSQGAANANLRVKITTDGRYVFVGCRTGPRVVMSINLHNYRNEKESEDEDFNHLQKHFHANPRARGFSDVTKYVPPRGKATNRHAYYLLCGLGVGNLHLWRFVEARHASAPPSWHYMYEIKANGNTAIACDFLPPAAGIDGSMSLTIAGTCHDKNMRVWELEQESFTVDNDDASNDHETGDDDDDGSDPFHGIMHTIKSHADIPNTKDIAAIYGEYAYGISPTGDAYRLAIRNPGVRHEFEMEKFDTGGSNNKSRRSTILLESVYASDDGSVMIVVSTEGIFYYANSILSSTEEESANGTMSLMKIIGKNASLNPQYKTPMKVYTPRLLASAANATPPTAMMAVVTNPASEDEGGDGYLNVDPTEGFAARWMVPSKGRDCWVCGVRNISHWQAPTENQQQKAFAQKAKNPSGQQDDSKASQSKRSSTSSYEKKANGIEAPSPRGQSSSVETTPLASPTRASKAKAKLAAARKSASASSTIVTPRSGPSLAAATLGDSSLRKPPTGTSSKARQRIEADEDGDPSPSRRFSGNATELAEELERYKERYNKIVMEWQRRLKGERQMRRLWKTRETEFNKELDDTLDKLYNAEQELVALKEAHKDAEKRFSFEKLKAEQQSSVKSRYEQLCAQLQEKLALLDDQKRVMEQTTKTLLQEVDRNVRALKPSPSLLGERNECVVCKDHEANTAIIPCGHLVFCEDDGEVYRRNAPGGHVVCPICQRELISLLRIY